MSGFLGQRAFMKKEYFGNCPYGIGALYTLVSYSWIVMQAARRGG